MKPPRQMDGVWCFGVRDIALRYHFRLLGEHGTDKYALSLGRNAEEVP